MCIRDSILRDSGLINNVWTGSIHDVAVALSGNSALFSWLAEATARPLPLLYNFGAVLIGLFYGYLPFMVLPLYSTCPVSYTHLDSLLRSSKFQFLRHPAQPHPLQRPSPRHARLHLSLIHISVLPGS